MNIIPKPYIYPHSTTKALLHECLLHNGHTFYLFPIILRMTVTLTPTLNFLFITLLLLIFFSINFLLLSMYLFHSFLILLTIESDLSLSLSLSLSLCRWICHCVFFSFIVNCLLFLADLFQALSY